MAILVDKHTKVICQGITGKAALQRICAVRAEANSVRIPA